ncbi:protein cereblon isoform X2 [Epargyreus clarus]|uniref:protein cereblon isoform X2 n=1 Tax=Epargyreus clarus TaxID=520877 RepID=UPI003C2C184A
MEDNVSSDSEAGGGDAAMEGDTDEEEEQFDISLPAAHSYMGQGLVTMSGRSVLEAGWEGRVPVLARHGTVFPGETVPLLLTNTQDALLLSQAIEKDKLFGLLCPDESGMLVSGYGVLCEVFEAGGPEQQPDALGDPHLALSCKARAVHRIRFADMPKYSVPIDLYARVKYVSVRVLPEVQLHEPLRHARLASLDSLRRARTPLDRRLRAMDAATTPWPLFVYDIFDYRRMRAVLRDHFKTLMLDNMPEEPVSLSFWVASNLTLSPRERLALFVVDDALLRLHMAVRFIGRRSVLCCSSCNGEIARREHVVPMSSEGVHSNYTNIGGYMHDIVTVSRAYNVGLTGAASAEFSWFPGYTWTVANCAACGSHIGWRFDAEKRNLRPQQFFGLCRNYVSPLVEGARSGRARHRRSPADDDEDDV